MRATSDPTISIVIPAYNAARFISRAIESVLHQTYPDVETVVVNDGSQDDTEDICLAYGNRIRYVSQSNRGPGGARNKGIEAATGGILGFLDADDELAPHMAADLMRGFAAFPQAGAVSGSSLVLEDSGKTRRLPLAGTLFPNGQTLGLIEHFFQEFARHNFTCVGAVLVKRSVLDTVGHFQEGLNHGEDIEMWSRIAGRFPWVHLDEVVHRYYLSSLTSISQQTSVDVVDEFCRGVFSEEVMRERIDADKWEDYRYFRGVLLLACVKYHIDDLRSGQIRALCQHVAPVPPGFRMHLGKALAHCPDGWLRLLGLLAKTYRRARESLAFEPSS